jgi:hypothetical protein
MYFAFLCAFASLRESRSYEKGWFTPRRKVAKDRKGSQSEISAATRVWGESIFWLAIGATFFVLDNLRQPVSDKVVPT